ncbi:phosphatase PAP2 family protein, partial [Candidatus Woesearchaeota archaeon]|nr:phosphatase PAP2 family protein [Candidatus Woesearchaeota archaeon]
LLVCYSRIYLGVHFFSDVLAGIFLGAFVVAALALAFGPGASKQKL